MKAASRLKKYYKKRTNSVRFILDKSQKEISSKDFHTLRVDIKKMRAMIALVQFSSAKIKKKKYDKAYKKLFKQAGQVRDLQIEKTVVEEIGINDSLKNYLNDLEKRSEEEKEKWFLLTNKKNKKKIKKNFKSLIPHFKKVNNSKVNKFIHKKSKSSKKIIKKQTNKKELHTLRKKLKVLYYVLNTFKKRKKLKIVIQKIQDLLGSWHDCAVMNRRLHTVVATEKLSVEEKSAIDTLKEKIARRRKKIVTKVNTSPEGLLLLKKSL